MAAVRGARLAVLSSVDAVRVGAQSNTSQIFVIIKATKFQNGKSSIQMFCVNSIRNKLTNSIGVSRCTKNAAKSVFNVALKCQCHSNRTQTEHIRTTATFV